MMKIKDLEKGKYLFVASLDSLDFLGKAYCKILFGPGCAVPLEITEFSYVSRYSHVTGEIIIGGFTLSDYVVEDILDNGSELLFCPKFLKLFKEVKEV